MNIRIIGTGYVGLVTGACFAEFGVTVTCMDTNPHRIQQFQSGELPFCDYSVLQERGFDYMSVGRTPVGPVASEESADLSEGKFVGAFS